MAPVARRNYLNPRVALNRRSREHGVGDKGIILCRNNERGDGDRVDDMACPYAIIVVGSAGISSVRCRIAMVEFAHPVSAVKILKIPLAGKERSLSSQSCFKFHK